MNTRFLIFVGFILGSANPGSIVSRSSVEDKSSGKETPEYSPEALESAYKVMTRIYFQHLMRLAQMDSVIVKDTLCEESNSLLAILGDNVYICKKSFAYVTLTIIPGCHEVIQLDDGYASRNMGLSQQPLITSLRICALTLLHQSVVLLTI